MIDRHLKLQNLKQKQFRLTRESFYEVKKLTIQEVDVFFGEKLDSRGILENPASSWCRILLGFNTKKKFLHHIVMTEKNHL